MDQKRHIALPSATDGPEGYWQVKPCHSGQSEHQRVCTAASCLPATFQVKLIVKPLLHAFHDVVTLCTVTFSM